MNEIKELLKIYPQDVILLMSLTQAYMDIQDYKMPYLRPGKFCKLIPITRWHTGFWGEL